MAAFMRDRIETANERCLGEVPTSASAGRQSMVRTDLAFKPATIWKKSPRHRARSAVTRGPQEVSCNHSHDVGLGI
jgi:hypothetical protein